VCHGSVVEASFSLAFGLCGTASRVHFAALNTSITRWRHDRGPDGPREWYAGRTVADEGRSAAQDVQGRAQDAAGTVGGNASNG
jgi:hypothetical protein